MTNPADLTPRERNRFMIDKIRAEGPAPYREGGYVLRVMSVAGRRTGESRSVPIAIPMVAAERYLCAPNRRRDWVRNLLAAGECEIEGDPVPRHRAVLAEDEAAALAVHTYLSRLGRSSPQWPFPGNASVPEISGHLTRIAVFRLSTDEG